MEIKLGITDVPRELTLETKHNPDDVEQQVREALTTGSVLALDDENGRRVLVPVSKLAYLELGTEHTRKVGFGAV